MAPIGLKAVVGESKIIFVLFCSKTGGRGVRRWAVAVVFACVCVCWQDADVS